MSIPTEPPQASAGGSRRRTLIISVLFAVLTFGGVVGAGLVLGNPPGTLSGAVYYDPYYPPDPAWTGGATQTWSTTIDTDAQVFSSGTSVFSLTGSGASSILTAYSISESGPSQVWTRTVDTSGDSAGGPTYPSFLMWGTTHLLHGTTVYEVESGEESQAPWSPGDAVVVAENIAIACDEQDRCTGYQFGSSTGAWTTSLPGAFEHITEGWTQPVSPLNIMVVARESRRYAVVGSGVVIDIDSGEPVPLTVPMDDLDFHVVAPAMDGWAVLARNHSGVKRIYAYEPAGGSPIDDYEPSWTLEQNQSVHYTQQPRSLEQFKAQWTESDTSTIVAVGTADSDDCMQSVEVLNASTIDLPSLEGTSGSCLQVVRFSNDQAVMTVGVAEATTLRGFRLMYDTASGKQISFEGLDPAQGAMFLLIDTTKVVGYDPTTGRLIGYRPA
ncbi:hypothetical protein [Actinomyces howellii]|uniref:Uncharacterized protein n=1 Tax=Actinomyces howellii TaxID=52771 RepID=A0A3S4V5F5_9ACTO|nr:hypothetical protein [Actinomyces howellii]VEG29038.1 Uncharacterised protein [Actinomyces howellii]